MTQELSPSRLRQLHHALPPPHQRLSSDGPPGSCAQLNRNFRVADHSTVRLMRLLVCGCEALQLPAPIQHVLDLDRLAGFAALLVDEEALAIRAYIKIVRPARKIRDRSGRDNDAWSRHAENRLSCYLDTHNVPTISVEQLSSISGPDRETSSAG